MKGRSRCVWATCQGVKLFLAACLPQDAIEFEGRGQAPLRREMFIESARGTREALMELGAYLFLHHSSTLMDDDFESDEEEEEMALSPSVATTPGGSRRLSSTGLGGKSFRGKGALSPSTGAGSGGLRQRRMSRRSSSSSKDAIRSVELAARRSRGNVEADGSALHELMGRVRANLEALGMDQDEEVEEDEEPEDGGYIDQQRKAHRFLLLWSLLFTDRDDDGGFTKPFLKHDVGSLLQVMQLPASMNEPVVGILQLLQADNAGLDRLVPILVKDDTHLPKSARSSLAKFFLSVAGASMGVPVGLRLMGHGRGKVGNVPWVLVSSGLTRGWCCLLQTEGQGKRQGKE